MAGIRILLYHSIGKIDPSDNLGIRVDKDKFYSQMKILKEGNYKVISLKETVDSIKKKNFPGDAVAITFDDGYRDNITDAAPILEKMGFRATFFVTVSYIGGIKTNPKRTWQRWECMDWLDLKELIKRGHDIGSHSYHHISLTKFNRETQREEIRSSKDILRSYLKKEINFYSYPYGSFDEESAGLAKEEGYAAACTTEPGINNKSANLYRLKRIEIQPKDTDDDFMRRLQG